MSARNVVLGVGGGIAAYKAATLVRLFTEAGHRVTVIPTDASLQFVGAATWEALSGRPVSNSVFDAVDQVQHVRLGQQADLVVVAPATADLLAKAATGQANDLLSTTLLMAAGPVLLAPAMHTEMWQHPATVANVATLRSRGAHVLDPAVGRLTGPDSGPGRLPEPADIFAAALSLLESGAPATAGAPEPGVPAVGPSGDPTGRVSGPKSGPAGDFAEPAESAPPADGPLAGRRVLVTAGGTREPLDPVRFLGNRSSGKQGTALAQALRSAGAEVTLVAAHMDVPPPAGVSVTRVETALELRTATLAAAARADAVIMAAAVADFRPSQVLETKIKKRDNVADPVITLVRNPDILLELVSHRNARGLRQVIVGFAAETGDADGDVLEYAAAKLRRKGCDLLVVNAVGGGLVFGEDANEVDILAADGADPVHAAGSKAEVAGVVVDVLARRLREH